LRRKKLPFKCKESEQNKIEGKMGKKRQAATGRP
jgi:hypothetical protein